MLNSNVVKLYQEGLNEGIQPINQKADINSTWEKVALVIKDTSKKILGNTQSEKRKT